MQPLLQNHFSFNVNDTVTTISPLPGLAFDSIMALGIAACQIRKPFFNGDELFDAFLQVQFEGASGPVALNPETGSRSYDTTAFAIINIVATDPDEDGMIGFTSDVVAQYYQAPGADSVAWHRPESGAQYNFSGFTLVPPAPLPELEAERDEVSTAAHATVSLVAGLVMLASFGFAVWTWTFRSSHVVRASQPEFLVVICLGSFLMAASAVVIGTESPRFSESLADVSCMLSVWLFCVGFGLAFSALFAKTWRINKVRLDGRLPVLSHVRHD